MSSIFGVSVPTGLINQTNMELVTVTSASTANLPIILNSSMPQDSIAQTDPMLSLSEIISEEYYDSTTNSDDSTESSESERFNTIDDEAAIFPREFTNEYSSWNEPSESQKHINSLVSNESKLMSTDYNQCSSVSETTCRERNQCTNCSENEESTTAKTSNRPNREDAPGFRINWYLIFRALLVTTVMAAIVVFMFVLFRLMVALFYPRLTPVQRLERNGIGLNLFRQT
ncbi:hypothetical protein ACOME3_004021 [Neoechinorhynchus agilis]